MRGTLEEFFAFLGVERFDEPADILGAIARGDEERIWGIDDDKVVDADQGDGFLGIDVVAGGVLDDEVAGGSIALGVLPGDFVDRFPTADIVPADVVEGDTGNAVGLLDDGVIDGDVFAERVNGGEAGGELAAGDGGQAGKQRGGFRLVAAEEFVEVVGAPEEHAGIPEEAAGAEELGGGFGIGLFAEALDGLRLRLARGDAFAELDIAVAGLRPAGLNAEDDEMASGGGGEGGLDVGAEARLPEDEVIGGKHSHDGILIECGEDARGEADAGSGIALGRFGDDLAAGDGGKLLANFVLQIFVGDDPDIFRGHDAGEAVDGLLDEGAVAEEAEDLLGVSFAAAGPEAGAAATGHDERVAVMSHLHFSVSVRAARGATAPPSNCYHGDVKIGVAGLGFMGATHIQAMAAVAGADLAAVAARNEKALSGDLSGAVGNLNRGGGVLDFSRLQKFRDWREMIAEGDIEAVDICLPTALHAEAAVLALGHGKHVLVEKPMALTAGECAEMLAARDRAGKTLMVAHVLRFWPEYQELRRAMDNGGFGAVERGRFERRCGLPEWSAWLPDDARSGGAVVDLLIHDVDQAIALFGLPREVSCRPLGGVDTVEAVLHYGDGLEIRVCGGWFASGTPFSMGFEIEGTRGTMKLEDGRLEARSRSGGSEAAGGWEPVAAPEGDGYRNEIAYFVDCCREGRAPVRCLPEDSARAVGLAALLREARREEGRRLPCIV